MKVKKYMIPLLLIWGCSGDFLDMKPQRQQMVLQRVIDYMGLLDNVGYMNNGVSNIGMIGSDEFFVTDARYSSISNNLANFYQKQAYLWEAQIHQGGEQTTDWSLAYQHILYCNMVIHDMEKASDISENRELANVAMGMALFHRAFNYYNLAQLYCPTYNEAEADHQLGLPLRNEPDVTVHFPRSSLKKTYDFIINDLESSIGLLPALPVNIFRPSQQAAFALLARLYLQIERYDLARQYATKALELGSALIDYNNISPGGNFSFPLNGIGNEEVILGYRQRPTLMNNTNLNVDTLLYSLYHSNDLRKDIYFSKTTTGQIRFIGSYNGDDSFFVGLATDELYLIRAESTARMDELGTALSDLDHLLSHRTKKESYIPYSSMDRDEVLDMIIEERRKELVFRGTRWEDLRRLNKDERYQTVLTRMMSGNLYSLHPGDLRWTWTIPIDAVILGGYEDNPR